MHDLDAEIAGSMEGETCLRSTSQQAHVCLLLVPGVATASDLAMLLPRAFCARARIILLVIDST